MWSFFFIRCQWYLNLYLPFSVSCSLLFVKLSKASPEFHWKLERWFRMLFFCVIDRVFETLDSLCQQVICVCWTVTNVQVHTPIRRFLPKWHYSFHCLHFLLREVLTLFSQTTGWCFLVTITGSLRGGPPPETRNNRAKPWDGLDYSWKLRWLAVE